VPRRARLALALLPGLLSGRVASQAPELALIPRPALVERSGDGFTLTRHTIVTLSRPDDAALRDVAVFAADAVREAVGRTAAISTTPVAARSAGGIHLDLDSMATDSSDESYRLTVRATGVTITAHAPAGLFYGVQTLRQLIAVAGPDGRRRIPGVDIRDRPRFAYRGMHLDVSRHFFPVSFIERYIDLLARYKLNTFHWHLTDDQGWRIEIRRYPRLTAVGAWRRETMVEKHFDPYVGDGVPHGGFYSQDDIRHVVAYARRRHVTIIPEIEMPGHAKAALAAYPELACTPGPFTVRTTWGVDEDVLCPTERTFAFLEGVLTEVVELFPGPYVHIGGDEVPKTRWERSSEMLELMQREHLRDQAELQSWFIRRIEGLLAAHGRRLIGWDEILEGGLAPEATVMSWRGTAGGVTAARLGHDAIMSPGSHLYFDHYQGDPAFEPLAIGGYTPLEKVYAYEPLPDTLTAAEARHVLGAQANLWTEYLATPAQVEYMAVPRMLALAEVVWSPRGARNWQSFRARLAGALRALDHAGVRYRVPPVEGLEVDRLTLADHVILELQTIRPDAVIQYSIDDSAPGADARRYWRPVRLPVTAAGVRVTARAVLPDGRASPAQAATFRRGRLRPAAADTADLRPGLLARYAEFAGRVRSVAALDSATAARDTVVSTVALVGTERPEWFGWTYAGHLHVPRSGIYTFTLTSDDGSTLAIGDTVVIDFDGYHGEQDRSGQIALAAGYHPIVVRYFQATGGAALAVRVAVDSDPSQRLSPAWLFHRP